MRQLRSHKQVRYLKKVIIDIYHPPVHVVHIVYCFVRVMI